VAAGQRHQQHAPQHGDLRFVSDELALAGHVDIADVWTTWCVGRGERCRVLAGRVLRGDFYAVWCGAVAERCADLLYSEHY
jgi:hypothetical protein